MSTGFIKKLDPPHSFPFLTNTSAIIERPIPFSQLPAPVDLSGRIINFAKFYYNLSIKNMSNILLWFDANDRNTITLSNNKVISWKSKVNDYTLFLQSPVIQYRDDPFLSVQNNKTFICPVEYGLVLDSISTRIIFTLILVFSSPPGLVQYRLGSFIMYTVNNNLLYLYNTGQGWNVEVKDEGYFYGVPILSPIVPINELCIMVIGYDLSYKAVPYRINGLNRDSRQEFVYDAPQGTQYFTSALNIDMYLDSNINSHSFLAEIIHFDRNLGLDEVEKIEGYLAEKWNLQDKLPETHPYKMKGPNSI